MLEIYNNYEIKNHTTFKIGGKVNEAAFPKSLSELTELLKLNKYEIVLGNCSNVLFSSENINKNIILTNKISDYEFNGNRVKVSAGTKGAVIANECRKRSLTGFEFLIGFPGSFGGMIKMNASAHNQAISDTFLKAKLYDLKNHTIVEFDRDKMQFGYRKSVINSDYIVLEAEFELKSGNYEKIDELMTRNIEFRKLRQPSLITGNAGSVFKNPENDSAGRLLDLCGFKGEIQGGAMVFENHANFIINKNNATSLDVLTLMNKMYSKVKEKYTIELKPEIIYIGDKETEEYRLWENITKENILPIQK